MSRTCNYSEPIKDIIGKRKKKRSWYENERLWIDLFKVDLVSMGHIVWGHWNSDSV